jgi:hypothetical protein
VRRLLLLISAVLTAACDPRPPEFGVSVFADDTLPVVFTVELTGSLLMGARSDNPQMRPDKSLLLTTPAQLVVQKGEGSATITALKGGTMLVQPLGAKPDSAATSSDTASASGTVVKLWRIGARRRVMLRVIKK